MLLLSLVVFCLAYLVFVRTVLVHDTNVLILSQDIEVYNVPTF